MSHATLRLAETLLLLIISFLAKLGTYVSEAKFVCGRQQCFFNFPPVACVSRVPKLGSICRKSTTKHGSAHSSRLPLRTLSLFDLRLSLKVKKVRSKVIINNYSPKAK